MKRTARLLAIAIASVALGWFLVDADQSSAADGREAAAASRHKRQTIQFNAETETEVLEFVREHHPELAELLRHLQAARPDQYERAICDLASARERLAGIQRRDLQRYELELRAWVLRSQIELTVAKLKMHHSRELRDELRRLLYERSDVRLLLLQIDRDRTREKLTRLDEQISKAAAAREASVERQWRTLTKTSVKNDQPSSAN